MTQRLRVEAYSSDGEKQEVDFNYNSYPVNYSRNMDQQYWQS